jgi:exopolysaccharide biosynthesis protein
METQKSRDYSWRENLPNYGLCLTAERLENLLPGVMYLQRDYIRNDGKPVQTHIVIADKDAPVAAAVWGSPQGQSQTVPEHVAQMESLGKNVIAAVNADFFHFFNNGDKTTYGAQIIDGVVHKEPNKVEHYGDNWFGLTQSGEYVMADLAAYESTYKGKLWQAVGGGVWLVREHVFCPHRSTAEEPRTAVAITDEGGLVLVCVDGRSEISAGATYSDLTQVFLDLDVPIRSALNLDGGHSTILMAKKENGEMKIKNNPSSGVTELRPVADILTLVK